MGRSEVDAVLERLVAQFASPYDFLRELVQNSMDAGADRVEVTLERHDSGPELDHGAAIFELSFVDTGAGMDESIIDGALTRLFSSSKADDRTMAGGFGVGFVSIFAWEPQLVLLQTGRGGESWELIFHEDRRFEKHSLDTPVEGTTITMLRSGDAGIYPAVAEAVRDALWRWCRYCPLEITFEDFSGDLGPELIQDAPAREEQVLARREQVRDGELRVAFGVPSHATLLRRGLILAEGSPSALVPSLELAGRSVDHLQLWIDSPDLETTLARDKVVESKGREKLEAKVHEALNALRNELVEELEHLCADPAPFSAARAGRYATLHAHLQLEWEHLEDRLTAATILRCVDTPGTAQGLSPQQLVAQVQGGPVLWATLGQPATLAGYPVLAVRAETDALWLEQLMARFGLIARPALEVLGALEPGAAAQVDRVDQGSQEDQVSQLCARMQAVLSSLVTDRGEGQGPVQVSAAQRCDDNDADPPLCAWRRGEAALTCRAGLPRAALSDLWLDRRHLIVRAAGKAASKAPRAALASLLSAVLMVLDTGIDPKQLAERLEQEPGAW